MKNTYALYGAILGDLAGQPYEYKWKGPIKNVDLHNPSSFITDDTIMTLASARSIIDGTTEEFEYKSWGKAYPGNFYGDTFTQWVQSPRGTIGTSYGNGCLMRISPFMWANQGQRVQASVKTSHDHIESLRASFILKLFYTVEGGIGSKSHLVRKVLAPKGNKAKYSIRFIDKIRKRATNIHEAIEMAVKGGGDTDTHASIVGELFNYKCGGLTEEDINYVESKLDPYQLKTLRDFNEYLSNKSEK